MAGVAARLSGKRADARHYLNTARDMLLKLREEHAAEMDGADKAQLEQQLSTIQAELSATNSDGRGAMDTEMADAK